MDDLAVKILGSLDKEQARAAQQIRGPVAIIAGPGSGKTRVVSHRIAYGIALGVYDPAKVLALTYTNRAATELRQRLRTLGAGGVQVRTVHSAALGQLQYFWPQLTDSPAPKLITAKLPLLKEAASDLGFKLTDGKLLEVMSAIEWHRYSLVEPSEESAQRQSAVTAEHFLALFRSFEVIKQQRKVIDWEDVLLLCTGLMRSQPRMLEHFQQQYRFFTIDEYQDISPLQQALIETWLGERQDICVVGDPRQTIYSFAGASSSFLTRFEDKYPSASVHSLVKNYRSGSEIVELANRIQQPEIEVGLETTGQVFKREYRNPKNEASDIARQVQELVGQGVKPMDIAVLTRANFQLEPIESALNELSLEVQVRGNGRFFSRPEVSQAMTAIRALNALPSDRPLFMLVSDILSSLGWRLGGVPDEKWQNLNWFLEVMEELDNPSVLEYSRELQERERSGHEPIRNAVTLATIHSTKGLEWPIVFLAGVNRGTFPSDHSRTDEQLAEERRLFYVAVTRAQIQLAVSYSSDKGPSPFVAI